MRLVLVALAAIAACYALPARAQLRVTPTACQAGTGSAITTVTGTASTVCSASTGARQFLNITNAAASGGSTVYCTWDGSTPSATNWSFPVYPQGGWVSTPTSTQPIPTGAIQCISASGSVTIKAEAIQAGAP